MRLKALLIDEQKSDTRFELDQCILKAMLFETKTKNDQYLNSLANKLIDKCPQEELEFNKGKNYNSSEFSKINYNDLVKLHSDLKNLILEKSRIEW